MLNLYLLGLGFSSKRLRVQKTLYRRKENSHLFLNVVIQFSLGRLENVSRSWTAQLLLFRWFLLLLLDALLPLPLQHSYPFHGVLSHAGVQSPNCCKNNRNRGVRGRRGPATQPRRPESEDHDSVTAVSEEKYSVPCTFTES